MTLPRDGQALHHALRACISEGRPPDAREVEQVAARIWDDTYRSATEQDWSDVEPGSFYEQWTLGAARVALGTANNLWAELAAA